jgi:hypothetical protein
MLINASGLIRYVPMVFLLSDIFQIQKKAKPEEIKKLLKYIIHRGLNMEKDAR